jgi:hypothetical protein
MTKTKDLKPSGTSVTLDAWETTEMVAALKWYFENTERMTDDVISRNILFGKVIDAFDGHNYVGCQITVQTTDATD